MGLIFFVTKYHPIMWKIIHYFKEEHIGRSARILLIVCNILINDLEPLGSHHPMIINLQFLLAFLTELFRELDNGVVHGIIQLSFVASEVVKDGLGCRASTRANFDDVDGLFTPVLLLVAGVGLQDVVSDCHPVVGFENLAGCQPRILRVKLDKSFLVVVVADHLFEVEWMLHLAYLKVCVRKE